jgi:tetratricopeptide (TPR) repeat protein
MITLLVFTLFTSQGGHASNAVLNRKTHDLAALSIQDQSIRKLQSLLKDYHGSREEPALLFRLADLYLERSGITFRISEGKSIQNRSALYLKSLQEAIKAYSTLIKKFPSNQDIPLAKFKRGKAYHELGLKDHARSDYLFLVNHHRDFKYLDSALMDLADDAQLSNEHEEALRYLIQIQEIPETEYLAIAIHKAAWSQFNLGKMGVAIESLHREIQYYYSKKKDQTASDPAFLESAFHDLALFHFESISKNLGNDSLDQALTDFKAMDRSGSHFGPTTLGFAKMLKAYSLSSELEKLKDVLIQKEKSLPETAEVIVLYYQLQFEKKNWNQIAKLSSDVTRLGTKKSSGQVETLISGALADLHKLVIRNKSATARETLIQPLVSLTESTHDLLGISNPTSLKSRYALAETFFELADYSRATNEYSKLLEPETIQSLQSANLDFESIRMRQLSSLYREIKNLGLLPDPFKILKIKSPSLAITPKNLEIIESWLALVPLITPQPTQKDTFAAHLSFMLEAAKLNYLYHDRTQALQNLTDFGIQFKDLPEGRTALSLALDTWVESEAWEQAHALAKSLSSLPLKSPDFESKIRVLAGTSYLKILESTSDARAALRMAEECLKQFRDSSILSECEMRRARSYIHLHESELAEKSLSQLISTKSDPLKLKGLLLLRSEVRSDLGKTKEAISDLERHQALDHYQDSTLNQRLLELAWFKGDQIKLNEFLKNAQLCNGKTENLCESYRLVRVLDQGLETPKNSSLTFKNTLRSSPSLRPLWTLIALKNPKKLPFQDRLVLLERLSSTWENLSPTLQIHLATLMISRVGDTFESIRISAPSIAPLTSELSSIERRMRLMKELDLAFSKGMKMGWTTLKERGVSELILIHTRLLSDLKKIHTPEEYLKPFESRVSELANAMKTLEKVNFLEEKNKKDPILLSEEIRQGLPESLWSEWKEGVQGNQMDYLFHLAVSIENRNETGKKLAPVLKGIVLALKGTGAEGLALVESAPDSGLKAQVVSRFQRSKP